MTALYFGWQAFRNRHFVIWGGGGWLPHPPLYSSLHSTKRSWLSDQPHTHAHTLTTRPLWDLAGHTRWLTTASSRITGKWRA